MKFIYQQTKTKHLVSVVNEYVCKWKSLWWEIFVLFIATLNWRYQMHFNKEQCKVVVSHLLKSTRHILNLVVVFLHLQVPEYNTKHSPFCWLNLFELPYFLSDLVYALQIYRSPGKNIVKFCLKHTSDWCISKLMFSLKLFI